MATTHSNSETATPQEPKHQSPTPPAVMPFTCQTCARRKVKCDKTAPICSSCRKTKLECIYQAPAPPRRKRKLSIDIKERLAMYERILSQHDLLPKELGTSSSLADTAAAGDRPHPDEPEVSRPGKLIAGDGQTRYLDNNLWHALGEDAMQRTLNDEEDDQPENGQAVFVSDPFTGAFMGTFQSVLNFHPAYTEAMALVRSHIDNVEPLCKILHIASTLQLVEKVAREPSTASKSEECLVFAIYHFAVFSMSEEECGVILRQSRAILLERYHFATRQALVNAKFLKTTKMSVLQALVLFLLPGRYLYDPHTFWILTGATIRIAQRMGLHRDGEQLGLSPFDVQMRRRLSYQLIPLDGIASEMSGANVPTVIDSWEMRPLLNVNDDQIWPGMEHPPEEQKGATEMIFCLARSAIGKVFIQMRKSMRGKGFWHSGGGAEIEQSINEAESLVEERYIRYCDVVNPLHFLTIGFSRAAITSMRLRYRLPKVRNGSATSADRKELFNLSQKIIDTDTALSTHAGLRKFRWLMGSFFVWGSWDSLIFNLTVLATPELLSSKEVEDAWQRMEKMYSSHPELLDLKQALHRAVGRLALTAWNACTQGSATREPSFITTLRLLDNRTMLHEKTRTSRDTIPGMMLFDGQGSEGTTDIVSDDLSAGDGFVLANDFDLGAVDWMYWDQLIQNYQRSGG